MEKKFIDLNLNNIFVCFYLCLLITKPQQRFIFLDEIAIERIVMIVAWFTVLICKMDFRSKDSKVILPTIFFTFLYISSISSDYFDLKLSTYWFHEFWKIIVFFYLIWVSCKSKEDIQTYLFALFLIFLFYQLYSWFDFFRGGSYVIQQGIKRIVGIWTSGIGAPNAFAMYALFSIPSSLFILDTVKQGYFRKSAYLLLGTSVLSIIFSGTRGALIALCIYFVYELILDKKNKIKIGAGILIACVVTFTIIPDSLKQRFGFSEYKIEDRYAEIQRDSAQERIDAFFDGIKIGLNHPIIGCGPGSSLYARSEIRGITEDALQLHSLYGQIFSETGIVGCILFLLNLIPILKIEFNKDYLNKDNDNIKIYLRRMVIIMLLYGISAHILYHFLWYFIFAIFCSCSILYINDEQNDILESP